MKGNVLRKSAVWATVLVLMISLGLVAIPTAAEDARVHVTGNNTWIVGNYGDNFVYDGVGYTPTSGFLNIDVSEESNTGIVVATWEARVSAPLVANLVTGPTLIGKPAVMAHQEAMSNTFP